MVLLCMRGQSKGLTEDDRSSQAGWRKVFITICCSTVAASLSAQVLATVGVYNQSNHVSFVATGSSVTLVQFTSDVATAFANNYGGVNQ